MDSTPLLGVDLATTIGATVEASNTVLVHSLGPASGCCSKGKWRHAVARVTVPEGTAAAQVASIKARLDADVQANMATAGTAALGVVDGKWTRTLRVIYNPHSGANRAGKLFEASIRPLLDAASIVCDVTPTTHSGHAAEMGQAYDPSQYEGVVFVSGDGTVKEFIDGLSNRPDWYSLMLRTPICSIPSGTANALAVGVNTSNTLTAVFRVIKHQVRPVDCILMVLPARDSVVLSLCGIGWGVPGDIAAESESCRGWGTTRYCCLKMKRGCLCPKTHTGGALWSSTRHPFVDRMLTAGAEFAPAATGEGDSGEETKAAADATSGDEGKDDTEEAKDDADAGATPGTAIKAFLEALAAGPPTSSSKTEGEEYGIEAVAACRRAQYSKAAAAPAGAAPASGKADVFGDLEELPTDPSNPPEGWCGVTGRFVAVGGVNTAQDSKFSRPSDGNIDFVSARKGGCFEMCGLLGRYVCGDEFKSPLMEHDKVQTLVVVPNEASSNYNVDGEVQTTGGAVTMLLLPGLATCYGTL